MKQQLQTKEERRLRGSKEKVLQEGRKAPQGKVAEETELYYKKLRSC